MQPFVPPPMAPPAAMLQQLQAMQTISAWQSAHAGLQAAVARVWNNVQRPVPQGQGPAGGVALSSRGTTSGATNRPSSEGRGGQITIELARSGRSQCRTCYGYIANTTLRVGKEDDSSDYSYGYTRWYHVACFDFASHGFKTAKDLSHAKGYSGLKRQDQLLVVAGMQAAAARNVAVSSAQAGAGSAAAAAGGGV